MNKLTAIIIGIVLSAAVFAVLIWVNIRVPQNQLENERFVPIPQVLQEGQDFTKAVQGLQKHGSVPITVQENDTGRSNPFSG